MRTFAGRWAVAAKQEDEKFNQTVSEVKNIVNSVQYYSRKMRKNKTVRIFTIIDVVFIENDGDIRIIAPCHRNDAMDRPFSSVVRASDS